MRLDVGRVFLVCAACTIPALLNLEARAQGPSAFTYQGLLKSGGQPANGTFDVRFSLFDALAGGNQFGPTLVFDGAGNNPGPLTISGGLFSAALDFGSVAFAASRRWIEVAVAIHGGAYTTLAPRQEVTAAPFALFAAAPWAPVSGGTAYLGGNVGIGTTAPAAKLDVAGRIRSSRSGYEFPDGSIQTTAANFAGVGSGTMILSADSIPPVGFASTGLTVEVTEPYSWTPRTSTLIGHGNSPKVVTVGNRIYVVGRFGSTTDTTEEYDPSTDTWVMKAPIPSGIFPAVAASAADKLYVGYGTTGLAEYDPTIDVWTIKTPNPVLGQNNGGVAGANGKVYFFRGYNTGPGRLNNTTEYNPATDTWTPRTPAPTAREQSPAAVELNGRIYVFGGTTDSGYAQAVDVYDPQADSWSTAPPVPLSGTKVRGCSASGRLFALFGQNSLVEFDPARALWTVRHPGPQSGFTFPGIASYGGFLYTVGSGGDGTSYGVPGREVFRYTPVSPPFLYVHRRN